MKKTVFVSLCSFATLLAFQTINAQTIAQWTFENTANTSGLTLAPGANTSPGTVQADNGLNYNVSTASGLHATAATYSTPAGDLDPIIAALAPGASGPGLPGSSLANWCHIRQRAPPCRISAAGPGWCCSTRRLAGPRHRNARTHSPFAATSRFPDAARHK